MNFAAALDALFPFLRIVHADRYDPYDYVVEPLYWGMVFSTFAGKCGLDVPKGSCVGYEVSVPDYSSLHHVRVRPRRHARVRVGEAPVQDVSTNEFAFVGFGDGQLWLSGPESKDDREFGGFDLARVESILSAGVPVRSGGWIWYYCDQVDFEFVAARS